MEAWYYCDENRVTHGPFDQATFDQMCRDGAIGAATLVWRQGWAQWEQAGKLAPPAASLRGPESEFVVVASDGRTEPWAGPDSANIGAAAANAGGTEPQARVMQAGVSSGGVDAATASGMRLAPAIETAGGMPEADALVVCSECQRNVPASQVAMLGGVPVCKKCQQLIIQRLVKHSGDIPQATGSGMKVNMLRLAGVVLAGFVVYCAYYFLTFKKLPGFGGDAEARKPAVWAKDEPSMWPGITVKVDADLEGKNDITRRSAAFVRGGNGKVYLVTSSAMQGEAGENAGFVLTAALSGRQTRWRMSETNVDLGAKGMFLAAKGTIWLVEVAEKKIPAEASILDFRRTRLCMRDKAYVLFHRLDGIPVAGSGANAVYSPKTFLDVPDTPWFGFSFPAGRERFPVGAPVVDGEGHLAGVVTFCVLGPLGGGGSFMIERLDPLAEVLGLPTDENGKVKAAEGAKE